MAPQVQENPGTDMRTPIIAISIASICCIPLLYAGTCGMKNEVLQFVIDGGSKTFLYELSDSALKIHDSIYMDRTKLTNIHVSQQDERSRGVVQGNIEKGLRLDMPYTTFNNNKMLIAAIYKDNFLLYPTKDIAIVDLSQKKVIAKVTTEFDVLSLAWSPDGKTFAVLLSKIDTKWLKNPLDLIANFFGHPVPYYTLLVEVYDVNGKVICRKTLVEKLKYGDGYILGWKNL